jgi:hypothetical protein
MDKMDVDGHEAIGKGQSAVAVDKSVQKEKQKKVGRSSSFGPDPKATSPEKSMKAATTRNSSKSRTEEPSKHILQAKIVNDQSNLLIAPPLSLGKGKKKLVHEMLKSSESRVHVRFKSDESNDEEDGEINGARNTGSTSDTTTVALTAINDKPAKGFRTQVYLYDNDHNSNVPQRHNSGQKNKPKKSRNQRNESKNGHSEFEYGEYVDGVVKANSREEGEDWHAANELVIPPEPIEKAHERDYGSLESLLGTPTIGSVVAYKVLNLIIRCRSVKANLFYVDLADSRAVIVLYPRNLKL